MELQEYINQVFELARTAKMVKTRAEFADLLEINRSSLSAAHRRESSPGASPMMLWSKIRLELV